MCAMQLEAYMGYLSHYYMTPVEFDTQIMAPDSQLIECRPYRCHVISGDVMLTAFVTCCCISLARSALVYAEITSGFGCNEQRSVI